MPDQTPIDPASRPHSTLPYPPIYKDAQFVALSDWDGTITMTDSNDFLTDNLGFGLEKRRALNIEVLAGKITFRDAFREMLQSVAANGVPFNECVELLKKNIKLDPGFKDFYRWCKAHAVPVVIVSSGMEPTLRGVLSTLLGDDEASEIDVICNSVVVEDGGKKWDIQYRHPDSGFGHDKSWAILPYRELAHRPTLFFFGDGVSDLSAAKHADLLFVKIKDNGENDLASYCRTHDIPHIEFKSFHDAQAIVADVVEHRRTVQEVLQEGK
ncbi:hypothetical protein DACRYDRAFT_22010 [Dacryopinax primogenitus]|uniref:HAD-like protein n=1 Tax=Dacryopinax primogenitus (strain DJM 731) TaxID=1858805 RepID=M5GDF0_DACPD|nr:uncharacterized protein DACRYDRAFT_22010 [Dacryopinax primogenitus]EJU02333.1 hypothetical protein DACRYDRAFT_22010 [Dacryopinax primogenitus]